MGYVVAFFAICVLIIFISMLTKEEERASEKPVSFRKPAKPNPKPKMDSVPRIYTKPMLLKGSYEVIDPDEANRIIADKTPLTTDLRIFYPKQKKTLKLLESLSVGMPLEVDWKEWEEEDGYGGQKNFYSVFVKTLDGKGIGSLDNDLRREVMIKMKYIRNCCVSKVSLEDNPKVRITIYYK